VSTEERRLGRIMVCVDGSEGSAAAIAWTISLARQTGAEIVAVHAFEIPVYAQPDVGMGPVYTSPPADPLWWDQLRKATSEAFEQEWCAPLARSGLPYRTVLHEGRPATAIDEVADRERPDLIVVGRRGLGGLTELLLGSVSHALMHHARRPITVVPHTS
jgi:nucleotide-binding universal stress UspA family protein